MSPMEVAAFPGTLLPTHADLFPIVQQMRDKYGLPEIRPDDEPEDGDVAFPRAAIRERQAPGFMSWEGYHDLQC